ncbi:MAG: bifunctional [glutamine synthetase] adenylyltransferase/[glutamine synthetase]-adenylyl-L-tyrosine phosphorylase [Hyphomicrobiales bacterium]
MAQPLAHRIKPLPEPADPSATASALDRLGDEGAAAELKSRAEGIDSVGGLLRGVLAASPFLTDLMVRDPEFAVACLDAAPEDSLSELCETVAAETIAGPDERTVKSALRRARAKAALVIALADLGGAWTCEEVTAALTRFADTSIGAAVDWLLREAAAAGRLRDLDPDEPGRGSGYVVLALGKHGAFELNYSSDVDLIILYDPDFAPLAEAVEPAKLFVRLSKRLVGLLQDPTEDGHAFRVDLRLRPDPRATQIAIAIEAAANHYEYMGQNWERAAMIKARPIAGDLALGKEFLDRLKPYVWRKYLDFAAIADIQSLKRQIYQVKGHGAIAVHGHNVKLGRGGIREIEFFVQTQQLIAGGRNTELRSPRTLDMLDRLAAAQWITPQAAADLKSAYCFLRRIEHRIQMVADAQTHQLPSDEPEFERLAGFCGYPSADAFAQALRRTFELVHEHSSGLFEASPHLSGEVGSLVFTGGEDDPETIATLTRLGFRKPAEVAGIVRSWHFGRYAAMRSAQARERLTEITPALLEALSKSGDPDGACFAFDRFLGGLPSGLQLFSLLHANPHLLDLLTTILGTAPRLAQELSHRPKLFDAVIEPDFFTSLPTADDLAEGIAASIPDHLPLEEVLERARVIGKEQMFRIGVQVLAQAIGPAEAGAAHSRLADALIARLLQAVTRDIEARHGPVPGGRAAVMAMGKLGGREMAPDSDLDLILIYDHDTAADASTGRKPLSISHYYARLTQRLIAACSAPTAEGVLYEVDMRLRPSGNQGPVASHIDTFRTYHQESAWTWERLALTRARVVAGPAGLRSAIEDVIETALTMERDAEKTRNDIVDMRRRLLAEFGDGGTWNLKHVHGGLIDVEFIAQGLQILHASENPAILETNTARALHKLAEAGYLKPSEVDVLTRACDLYHRMIQLLRLCITQRFELETAPHELRRLVAAAAAVPDAATAEALLADTQADVRALFASIIGEV